METEKIKKRPHTRKSMIIGLAVATGILSFTTLGLGISQGVTNTQLKETSNQLEGVYEKNYYELVDSTNSCDTDMSKLLSAKSEDYQAKMLNKVSQSAKEMQSNIAALPLENENMLDCVKFINQMSGYTQILEEKLSHGGKISSEDFVTLEQMHTSLNDMKNLLNDMSVEMMNGVSILDMRRTIHGDYDGFSWSFTQISSTEYPTMIYDGPFSDSVENAKIVGLSGSEKTKEEAYAIVNEMFANASEIIYQGETTGKFETYNFRITNAENQKMFVQVTKIGGHILTISGASTISDDVIEFERAEEIALNFARKNDIENPNVVWSQKLNGMMYFNLAPIQDGIIIYPDLVKVKVDLGNGNVVGYDAIAYFTNHTERNLDNATISVDDARQKVGDGFQILQERLVLSPLDFNREVLCYEFECEKNGATFYFYINAQSGAEENILKVVETSNGEKLM